MNIKHYIVPLIIFVGIGFVGYLITNTLYLWDTSFWLMTTGVLNSIAFVLYMFYNPRDSDMRKPKKVLLGWMVVENEEKNRFDYSKSSGDSFVDSMGYGFNPPNLVGLALGIIFILISIAL